MEDKELRISLRKLLEQQIREAVVPSTALERAKRSAAVELGLVPGRRNQSLVSDDGALEATPQALKYDDDESLVRTAGKGWRFRLKVNALNKNLRVATAATIQKKNLIDATADLEEAETGYQNRVRVAELKTALERQELETGIAEEELKKFKAEQEIERLSQANLLEQEAVSPRSAADEMRVAVDLEKDKARALLYAQESIEEYHDELVRQGKPAEEIEKILDRLERALLRRAENL